MNNAIARGIVGGLMVCTLAFCGCGGSASSVSDDGTTSSSSASSSSASTDVASSSSASSTRLVSGEPQSTDQMFGDDVVDGELYVYAIDGKVYTVDGDYELSNMSAEVEDDGFYKVIADITYLNGGVAGYVNYPDIKHVTSCEKVQPKDAGLKSLGEATHGVLLIGDYADGDVLLNLYSAKALLKDGVWQWHYDKELTLEDGTEALVRNGVSESDVQAGRDAGTLSCADYFVLPTTE